MLLGPQELLTGPSYDVNVHIERVRALHDAYPLKGNEATHAHTIEIMRRVYKRLSREPAQHILELVYGVIAMLLEKERIYDPPFHYKPDRASPPTYLKQALIDLERTMSEPYRELVDRAIEEMAFVYLSNAPEGCFIEEDATATKVPLYESIDAKAWVAELSGRGFVSDGNTPLFPRTREQLLRNLFEASGRHYDLTTPSEKLTYAKSSKLPPDELIPAYLHDTPLHALLVADIPFSIPKNTRFSGQWVLAPPNRGKTNMLLHQIEQDLKENASILVMDSKGDLINPLKTLAGIKDRLVVLEPSLEHPLAINPLDLGASTTHAVSFIEYIFSSLLESEPTALQNTLFRAVLLLLRGVPDATFADFRKILIKGWKDYEQHLAKLDPEDQEFFTAGEFDSQTYSATKTQLLWRIRDLTTRIPILRATFRAPKTRINMGELMDSGKVVILDVRKQLLGDEGAEFLGRLYIALVRAAADQRSNRPQSQKLPCYFYIDEAHTIISKDAKLAGIIQECRSQNVAMILAHQAIAQIASPVTLAALSDCAIRMANSDDEGSHLAPRLRTTPEMLRSLPIGTFATFVRDTTKQAVKLRIPLSGVPTAPRMSQDEQTALRARMRAEYAVQAAPAPTPPTASLDDALQAFAAHSPPQSTSEKSKKHNW